MTTNDTYKSIASASEGLFKDNGSRFIALAYPVESEEEVREIVSLLRKEYHDARHHCYAYRLGVDGAVFRSSDDGEPSGSAGRPILGQIDSAGLSDILVVVVRYFGGIKLGIPGLIRAYKTSTADAISNARVIEKIAGDWYVIEFDYSLMQPDGQGTRPSLPCAGVRTAVQDGSQGQKKIRGRILGKNGKIEYF